VIHGHPAGDASIAPAQRETTMASSEYVVVERIVSANERHESDNNNPGFCGVDSEAMMLRNYAQQGYRLVSVITEPVSNDESRRVFYLTRDG
jgi:hypothetical protein